MRSYLFIVIFFTGFISRASAWDLRPKPDSLVCLLMDGKVLNADEGADNTCVIQLICDSSTVDSVILKGKKKFHFDLKKNRHYTIRISKTGYLTKSICVHTAIPDTQTNVFEFEFVTTLSAEKPGHVIEEDVRNLPVASIYFHEKKNTFFYHRAFSTYYQKQLCKEYQ